MESLSVTWARMRMLSLLLESEASSGWAVMACIRSGDFLLRHTLEKCPCWPHKQQMIILVLIPERKPKLELETEVLVGGRMCLGGGIWRLNSGQIPGPPLPALRRIIAARNLSCTFLWTVASSSLEGFVALEQVPVMCMSCNACATKVGGMLIALVPP